MNILKNILLGGLLLASVSACKKDQYYLYNDVARIQFGPDPFYTYKPSYSMLDTMKPYTFYYEPVDVVEDTVFFDIYAIGGTSGTDRPFKLEQVMLEGEENAVAGEHYKDFSDASLKAAYVMKAGEVHTRVPVVVLRDASLKDKSVKLQIRVAANDQFQTGEPDMLWRRVELTDRLSRPLVWDESGERYYWGKYSSVKHAFMVEQTGERWDQEYMTEMMTDYGAITFWRLELKTLLVNYNNAHPGEPLTDENGEVVVFP